MSGDEITDALIKGGARMAEATGATIDRSGDAGLLITGVQDPFMNGVLTLRASVAAADVEQLLDMVAATGLPHRLTIRPGCSPGIVELARSRGFVERLSLPLMAMERDVESMRAAAMHPDLTIRQLAPEEAGIHVAITSDAFQGPLADFEKLTPPSLLRIPGIRVYAGLRDAEAVTTAAGNALDDYVLVFDVATPERHRGHGYGAAITARAVLDGFEAGASVAYLQSSPMGLGIYERLGFRTLETWSVWVSAPPSHS